MEIYLKVFIYREEIGHMQYWSQVSLHTQERIQKETKILESADSLCSVVLICSTV
jgi:hypothetical protein